jgi:hypothetical protein
MVGSYSAKIMFSSLGTRLKCKKEGKGVRITNQNENTNRKIWEIVTIENKSPNEKCII